MYSQLPIVAFSHLRWDFVYQRPQHLLSRLARSRRVVVIEEPVFSPDREAHWERLRPEPGILVCRPHTPIDTHGFSAEQLATLQLMVRALMMEEALEGGIAWLYTPLALPLARALEPAVLTYDCMDELSLFFGAPAELLAREAELLHAADVVFTGGRSLHEAKRRLHRNIHCFPSSVDAAHFGPAAPGAHAEEPADQAELPHPRLGYYGVIDERLDLDVVDAVAAAHPEWQIVMVGPVVKIDAATLPRRPNIHYLGQRTYADLPAYLAGWDLCLLPFARNDATRFISPTKLLEYMVAERPIVSTPIADVAGPYGHIVYLGDSPAAFLRSCEMALASKPEERARRADAMREVLAHTSWDATAAEMERLIAQAAAPQAAAAEPSPPIAVIGAGPTGLSAAYHLGADAILIEQGETVGGWCRSVEDHGFTFDYAGHIMFTNDPYVLQLYDLLLGENVHWQDREAWIYSHDTYTRYPFQGALHGLPPAVIAECITGAIEARFGSLSAAHKSDEPDLDADYTGSERRGMFRPPAHAGGAVAGSVKSRYAGAERRRPKLSKGPPRNFEEFIYKVWGAGIAKHFAVPYNRKLWAVPLDEMETSWLGGRVPLPDLREMIEGALSPVPRPMGPNARFGYPLRGGFQALMNGFLPHLRGPVRLGTTVTAISPAQHSLELASGETLPYEQLISTMPLPALVELMGSEAPAHVRTAADALRHVSVRCVNIGVGRERLTEKHWIYYPGDTIFHRVFVQGNASPYCNAPGGFGLTCEITYSPAKPLPLDGEDLIRRCIDDCVRVGLFDADDPIICANQVDMPVAYVVYDHERAANVTLIREWLAGHDIVLAGRYAEWEYYNSDHAFIAGKKAAEQTRSLQQEQFMAFPRAASLSQR